MEPVQFEIFTRRGRRRSSNVTWSVHAAIHHYVDWSRRTIRIRTFYDRHLRRRVVQFLVGEGF